MSARIMLVLAALLISTSPLHAANVDDIDAAMRIGDAIGQHVAGAVSAAMDMRANSARLSAEIAKARRDYWQAVKTGKGVEAAGNHFRDKLWEKDLVYLWLAIPEGADGPRAVALDAISGAVDGGIRPSARDVFTGWVYAIRVKLGAELGAGPPTHRMVIPGLGQLGQALEATERQRRAYMRARDWAEMDASGLNFPWHTDDRAWIRMMIHRYLGFTDTEGISRRYKLLADLFGEEQMLKAASAIRVARRNEKDILVDYESMGLQSGNVLSGFMELVVMRDGQRYFTYLIWEQQKFTENPAAVKREYDRIVWAFGEKAVRDVGLHLAKLPKVAGGKIHPDAVEEAGGSRPYWAAQVLLNRREPVGRVRHLIAMRGDVTSLGQADAIYNDLIARYGRERVIEAGDAVAGPTRERYDSRADQQRWKDSVEKYGSAFGVLVAILDHGVDQIMGPPPAARGSDERYVADADAQGLTGYLRDSYILKQHIEHFRRQTWNGNPQYPHAMDWVGKITGGFSSAYYHILDPSNSKNNDRPFWVQTWSQRAGQAVRTIQLHADLLRDPESEAARLAQVLERYAEPIWEVVRQHASLDLESIRPRPRGGQLESDGVLSDIIGTWTGTLMHGPRRYPMTLTFALPSEPGVHVGDADYGPLGTAEYHFLGAGFVGAEHNEQVMTSYTFRAVRKNGSRNLAWVRVTGPDRLEISWHVGENNRRTATALLTRGSGATSATAAPPRPPTTTRPSETESDAAARRQRMREERQRRIEEGRRQRERNAAEADADDAPRRERVRERAEDGAERVLDRLRGVWPRR